MKHQITKTTTTRLGNSRWLNPGMMAASLATVLLAPVLSLSTLSAFAAQRPISDFLSRQGMWSLRFDADGNVDCNASTYDGGLSGFLFSPPLKNGVDWTAPQDSSSAGFDYFGLIDAAVPGGLGTTMDGSINEVVHPDGTVTDTIVLHTTHALAWATTGSGANGTDLFGHQGVEVLAGAAPAFGSCTLKLVLKGPAANQPLPDFYQLLWGCGSWQIASVSFVGSASGPLPDGTPGQLQITETGLLSVAGIANFHSRVAFDAFPAEHILIKPTGP